jgi:hypothetical protein
VTDRLFGAPLGRAVRQQTARINSRRRKAFAYQWQQLLCPLAEELTCIPEAERAGVVRNRVADFGLTDQRGRNKEPRSMVAGANVWVDRDGELWEASIPQSELRSTTMSAPDDAMPGGSVPASFDKSKAKLLRPRNQPAVLLREYEAIYSKLKARKNDLRNAALQAQLFPDVEEATHRRWMEGRTPTPSELALLVAADRAKLVPSRRNLSRFRQLLAEARKIRAKVDSRLKLYRRVTPEEAQRTLQIGFRDQRHNYGTDREWAGVWVSQEPLDANEGTALAATALLEIELALPESAIADYEWVEDAKPHREWLVPAELLNAHAKVRLMSEAEETTLALKRIAKRLKD